MTRQFSSGRRDRGRDAQAGGGLVGQPLGLAVDAQQRGVLARLADHIVLAAERDAEVAVGDAAVERLRLAVERTERGSRRSRMSFRSPTAPEPPVAR